MDGRRLALSWVLAGSALIATIASAPAEPRAVLELFTSQGCSSCPAADKLLGSYAKGSSVIAMSLAIDYWDYLGWKDTLALAGHSRRQQAYARARGDREVYTPQMVVNGIAQVIGSDRDAIERAIAQTRENAATLTLPVTMAVDGDKVAVNIAAGQLPVGKDGHAISEVWLCPMTTSVPVAIERGENRGKTIIYHNVVRRWIKLGNWSGKAETWHFAIADLPHKDLTTKDIDSVAVVVQSGVAASPSLMLGAAAASLR
jgi:hypothetical protein